MGVPARYVGQPVTSFPLIPLPTSSTKSIFSNLKGADQEPTLGNPALEDAPINKE